MIQKIKIIDLKVNCIIGAFPHEREVLQDIYVDVVLEGEWSPSFESDDLADTLDYDALSKKLTELLKKGRYILIEKAARVVADYCFGQKAVKAVTVTIKKPDAIKEAQYSAFEISLP